MRTHASVYVPCVCTCPPHLKAGKAFKMVFTHALDTPGMLSDGRTHGRDGQTGRTDKRKGGRTDGRTDARTHARMHTRKDGRTDGRDAAEPRSRQRPLITLSSLRTEAIMPSKVTFDLPCALLVLSCPQHPVDHATVRAALTLWQGANLCKPRATPTQEVTLRVPSAYLVHSNLTACSFKW